MKAIWQFIIILLITAAVLTLYSFSNIEIKAGDFELKKSKLRIFIIGDTTPVDAKIAIKITHEKPKTDSSKQRILLIGDSMLEQLRWRARDYAQQNGHDLKTVMWYSSQSMWYGKYDTLKYFINDYKPTYIILVLGANELFVRDIKQKRAKYVKNIIKQIDTIPFIWVGPPNWRDDTGINHLILRYAGRRNYYPSYLITQTPTFARYGDGAHPKPKAAANWMDSVAVWIMDKSRFPILLNLPDKKYKGSTNTTILQPLK